MSKKHELRTQILVIAAILCASVVILLLNYRMIFNVTSRQSEELGTLQMNDIRAELQQTLDKAKQQTMDVAHNVDLILLQGGTAEDLEVYLRDTRSRLSDSTCINVYCAGPDWYAIPDFGRL